MNIIEVLRSAVEHRERITLDDIDAANLLAEIERLRAQVSDLTIKLDNESLRAELDAHSPCAR